VSPLELATAYSAFAGLGEVAEPRLVLRVRAEDGTELFRAEPPKTARVMDAGIAFLVNDVLREALDRGTGRAVRAAGFGRPAAGKTGTTNDAADAWFVGYTPRVVAAVWIGFDEPRPIVAVASGGKLAAPVWGRMMARARSAERADWKAPGNVLRTWVDPESGAPLAEGCRSYSGEAFRELFLRGSMPRATCPERGNVIEIDFGGDGSEEDVVLRFELWPHDLSGDSEPPPSPEFEEEERSRRREEELRRSRREREAGRRRRWDEEVSAGLWRDVERLLRTTRRKVEQRREEERRRKGESEQRGTPAERSRD
jgi:membrane peptidoglycan carboxypeptidase